MHGDFMKIYLEVHYDKGFIHLALLIFGKLEFSNLFSVENHVSKIRKLSVFQNLEKTQMNEAFGTVLTGRLSKKNSEIPNSLNIVGGCWWLA